MGIFKDISFYVYIIIIVIYIWYSTEYNTLNVFLTDISNLCCWTYQLFGSKIPKCFYDTYTCWPHRHSPHVAGPLGASCFRGSWNEPGRNEFVNSRAPPHSHQIHLCRELTGSIAVARRRSGTSAYVLPRHPTVCRGIIKDEPPVRAADPNMGNIDWRVFYLWTYKQERSRLSEQHVWLRAPQRCSVEAVDSP